MILKDTNKRLYIKNLKRKADFMFSPNADTFYYYNNERYKISHLKKIKNYTFFTKILSQKKVFTTNKLKKKKNADQHYNQAKYQEV